MKKRLLAIISVVLVSALMFSSLAFYKKATADSTINVTISGNYLRGIPNSTTFMTFKRSFTNPHNWNWRIYSPDATGTYEYLTNSYSGYIGTGFYFKIERGYNNIDSYDIVVPGDLNGDGIIDQSDYLALKFHVKRVSGALLTGAYLKAADLNNDGNVTATDYLRLKRYLAGLYNINGINYVTDPTSSDTVTSNTEGHWYTGWY